MLSLTKSYGEHVLKQGQEIAVRKTYRGCWTPTILAKNRYEWGSMVFEHPSTFDTLAMGTKKKEEIKKDLIKFSKGKDYYAKIGKAWNLEAWLSTIWSSRNRQIIYDGCYG
jgi:chaperone BCS1